MHSTMNASFIVTGLLTIARAIALRPFWPQRQLTTVALVLWVITGLGRILVGWSSPENKNVATAPGVTRAVTTGSPAGSTMSLTVSGHRLSAAGVESALVAHPLVTEAAVIAVSDELTGQSIVAYVMLRAGTSAEPALKDALRQHVAERIGKRARPKRIIWADDVPKARFGKIVCRLLRDIAEGRNPGDAATLRDPSVLAKLQQATTQDDSESAGAPETGNTR